MRAGAIVGIVATLCLAAAAQQQYEIVASWAQVPGGRLPEWELARVAVRIVVRPGASSSSVRGPCRRTPSPRLETWPRAVRDVDRKSVV